MVKEFNIIDKNKKINNNISLFHTFFLHHRLPAFYEVAALPTSPAIYFSDSGLNEASLGPVKQSGFVDTESSSSFS